MPRSLANSQVQHLAPDCSSEQRIRCVAGGRSEAIFKGRINVPQAAQRTDAQQLCRSLLLSDTATVNVMPSLEVVADDVSCTHGATVADLDGDGFIEDHEFNKAWNKDGADRAAAHGLGGGSPKDPITGAPLAG